MSSTHSETERSVNLERTGKGRFRATNQRGGTLDLGEGDDADFSPVELLLVAIAGCTAIDVDHLIGKRVDPDQLSVAVRADKIRDDLGNRLTNITLTFDVGMPEGPDGDVARQVLPRALHQSHDRLCTVMRTVIVGTPVDVVLAGD
ncbi:OsmC family protein [Aeromicrobium sp.]|uniref:OsmC family protein n=1 Tax=Aeromicrobium sp. TaxID=1871063 RepID=UPI0019CDD683|nr:OsmC family protein [Aeromicrobium sp.]MBC7630105.1 OsmC family protein [Aeromicrobium sp.]